MFFDIAIERVLGHEGGYTPGENDPGGETKWGISKRSYQSLNIATLTREDAKQIYHKDFWLRINADKLPTGVAYQLLDFAINSGIETAIRHFQRALGVADDGHWGPVSQAAANSASESDMIMWLAAERLHYMTRLKNWPVHGRGWAKRIAENLRYGAQDS